MKIKYTILNGCYDDNSFQVNIVQRIQKHISEKLLEDSYDWIDLIDGEINPCRGCDYCQIKNPGICAIKDSVDLILKKYMSCKVAIIITPIQFGCCNALTKHFIDRTEPLFLPFQVTKNGTSIMKGRYSKYPKLYVIGIEPERSIENRQVFKDFIRNCNVSAVSEEFKVTIISEESDFNELEKLII